MWVYFSIFLLGFIAGMICKDLLPADVQYKVDQYLKIKKSNVSDSQVKQDMPYERNIVSVGKKVRPEKKSQLSKVGSNTSQR